MITTILSVALLLAAAPDTVLAQSNGFYNYNGSGSSYGVRIGIGVGVALAVALVVLGVGALMRKRRARAFKQAYPVQPNAGYYGQQQQPGGPIPLQETTGNPNQQYPQQPAYQNAPPYANYRPDGSGYTPSPYPTQETPQPTPYYPPPSGPPPAHFQPPAGPPPPPIPSPAYDPTNMPSK